MPIRYGAIKSRNKPFWETVSLYPYLAVYYYKFSTSADLPLFRSGVGYSGLIAQILILNEQ